MRRLESFLRLQRLPTAAMIRFGFVGGLNTLIDFVLFATLYVGIEAPVVFSNVVAWLIATANSYVLNTRFTFKTESSGEKPLFDFTRIIRFFGVSAGALLVSTGLLVVLAGIMPALIGKAVLIGIMPLLSFAAYRLLVYRT